MKVKTGGGGFDPRDRHIYFIAGDRRIGEGGEVHRYALIAANVLTRPQALSALERLLDTGSRVMLDSGIFTLASTYARETGTDPVDAFLMPPEEMPGFEQLWDLYCGLVSRYQDRLWGYVEMDLGGTESKRRLRARLADEHGFSPIPVYHPLWDGWDYFDELAEGYDRVCWANLASSDRVVRKRMLMTAWERHRRHPDLWLHLLGVTPNEWLPGLPADSCDSSSWMRGVRWGGESGVAAGREVGKLPLHFRYVYDADPELLEHGSRPANPQIYKAITLAAANSHYQATGWKRQMADLQRALGQDPYPPVLHGES